MDEPVVQQNPVARHTGLVIQEVSDEVLVYDLDTNKAHCLNRSAAFVWKCCDGSRFVSDIVHEFELNSSGKVTEDFIWLAIDQLNENGLLENAVSQRFQGRSRRQVLKTIGMASAVALPIIASLAAPPTALGVDSCVCASSSQCFMPGCMGPICNNLGICAQNAGPKKG